jgi:hypothetical protein
MQAEGGPRRRDPDWSSLPGGSSIEEAEEVPPESARGSSPTDTRAGSPWRSL